MLKYYYRAGPLTSSRLDRSDIGALEVCFLVPIRDRQRGDPPRLRGCAAETNAPPTPDIRRQRRPSASRSSNWTLRASTSFKSRVDVARLRRPRRMRVCWRSSVLGRGCLLVGHVVFEHAVDEQGELTRGPPSWRWACPCERPAGGRRPRARGRPERGLWRRGAGSWRLGFADGCVRDPSSFPPEILFVSAPA